MSDHIPDPGKMVSARYVVARAMLDSIGLSNTSAAQGEGNADAILSALAAAGYVIEQDWQPIETAPTDGTAVLCWPFNYSSLFEGKAEPEIVIGFFSEDDWWCESTVAKTFDPTHWRPLPAPPKGQPCARASAAAASL